MDDQGQPHGLLNIFEVELNGTPRHLVCFLEPSLAGHKGIDERSIVGEFTPGEDHDFNLETFELNPAFVDAFTGYMNAVAIQSPGMNEEATRHASGWLYVLDPRFGETGKSEPEPLDLLGGFVVDDGGRIVPDSFVYNEKHQWFSPDEGVSGVLSDRQFYDWLHASTAD